MSIYRWSLSYSCLPSLQTTFQVLLDKSLALYLNVRFLWTLYSSNPSVLPGEQRFVLSWNAYFVWVTFFAFLLWFAPCSKSQLMQLKNISVKRFNGLDNLNVIFELGYRIKTLGRVWIFHIYERLISWINWLTFYGPPDRIKMTMPKNGPNCRVSICVRDYGCPWCCGQFARWNLI